MASPYLEKPLRSLPQAIEEIARERGVPAEKLHRQSGSAMPPGRVEPTARSNFTKDKPAA